MPEKILITGGDGFIGRYLCRECDKRGITYCVLKKDADSAPKQNIYCVDIRDADGLAKVMQEYQPDSIIHLAAIASVVYENTSEIYDVNVRGSETLLNAAQENLKPGSKLILISTAGVYGNQSVDLLTEDLPFNPANHYSISKMATEILSRQYKNDLDIHIVRPFNVIGVGQNKKFLIPKLVEHFAERKKEIQLGNLSPVRDYISVEFCAEVLLELATANKPLPEVLNICSGIGHSGTEVIELLGQITGYCPELVSKEEFSRKNEVWSLVGSTKMLDGVMEGKKQEALEAILKRMLAQY